MASATIYEHFAMVCILVDFCVHFAKQNVSKMFRNPLAPIVLHFAYILLCKMFSKMLTPMFSKSFCKKTFNEAFDFLPAKVNLDI